VGNAADAVAEAVKTTSALLAEYSAQAESAMTGALAVTQQYDENGAGQAQEAYAAAQKSITEAVEMELKAMQDMIAQVNEAQQSAGQALGAALSPETNQTGQGQENPEQAIVAAIQGMTGAPG
jgi:uncharacterized protein YukE